MKKINLLYDASCLLPHLLNGTGTGVFIVAYNVLKELCYHKRFNIILYCPKTLRNKLRQGLKNTSGKMKRLKIFNEDNFSGINAYFSPLQSVPEEIERQSNIRKYLFLHDTIPLRYPEYWKGQSMSWYFDMFQSLNKYDFYFTNSISTQKDFMKYNHNVTEKNSSVAYLASSDKFKPEKHKLNLVKKKYNIPEDKRYIFSLCTLEPRKNLLRSIKTFIQFIDKNKIADMVFVLGGGSWKAFMSILEQELSLLGKYRNKILTIGYVADQDLAPLYSGAEWFVYTSQYEGFGLPPLEAMACGCPVITSNNSSLPEVVGDAGVMIDWDSDEQHIKAYEKYYFDKKFRDEMAEKGVKRSKLFSWKNTVKVMEEKMQNDFETGGDIILENKEKINLLVGADVLANALKQSTMRSGVFFVVYNMLRELRKYNQFNVTLYVDGKNIAKVRDILDSDNELKDFTISTSAELSCIDAFLSLHADIPDEILQHGNIRTYKLVYDFMGCIFSDKIFSTKIINHQKAVFCNKLFCISESTKRDYLKFVPEIDSSKLVVTHLGVNERFCHKGRIEVEKLKKKLNIKGKYILSVCNLAPHKNLFTAIDAFIDFIKKDDVKDLSYVLVGGCPEHFRADFDKKMESLGKYKKYITLTGYLPDIYLPILYSGAEWFVFSSLYEGFGLPILEAMACGCPVVSSNTSSMPEILGDCGILVSPKNKNAFVNAFAKMYSSANFRKKCAYSGMERSKRFSWDSMVGEIANEINRDCTYHAESPELPIVLITDNNYVIPTIVTITSLLANRYYNTKYRIYVLGNSLSKKSKDLFSQIPDISLINLHKFFSDFEGTHGHVSAAALLKFKLAEMFPQYDKILYLDTDMIIQKDLSELFNIQLEDKYAAVVKDMKGMENCAAHKRLQLEAYFNSGMMLLNLDRLRKDKIFDKLIDYKKNKDIRAFMDQDCFNAVFNGNVIYLPCTYNYMPVNQSSYTNEEIADFYGLKENIIPDLNKYAYIIHMTNKQKPWNYCNVFGADLWARYYYMSILRNCKIKYFNDKFVGTATLKNYKKFWELFFKKEKGKYARNYRILGINFSTYRRYFNKRILFSKLKNIDFKISGFNGAESWGRWSNGFTSMMIFNLGNLHDDLLFKFEVKPFFALNFHNQKVKVYVNDRLVAQWIFEQGKPMPKTEFVITKSSKTKKGKVFLRFEYDNPQSPKELGISGDSRKLALGFISMQITPVIVKETSLQKWWKKIKAKIHSKPPVDYTPAFQALSKELIDLKGVVESLQKEIKTLKK